MKPIQFLEKNDSFSQFSYLRSRNKKHLKKLASICSVTLKVSKVKDPQISSSYETGKFICKVHHSLSFLNNYLLFALRNLLNA